jgi:hypothetical protein
MSSSRREERIQANNDRFREANETIQEQADRLGADMDQLPFLCECPDEECVEIVLLTRAEYTDVRKHDDHYVTAVGHEDREKPIGQVVARNNGYIVVAKPA